MTAGASDPTQAGFVPPEGATVFLSASEVEALCLKAARGAGFEWGLAEEAGFAARWLFSRGLDGAKIMLDVFDARGEEARARINGDLVAPVRPGHLCPVALGALLSDMASVGPDRLRAHCVWRPVILLPFLHQRCVAAGGEMRMSWSNGAVEIAPDEALAGDFVGLADLTTADVTIAPSSARLDHALDARRKGAIATSIVTRLDAYAMRTTVPATAASRADAGAGIDDND